MDPKKAKINAKKFIPIAQIIEAATMSLVAGFTNKLITNNKTK
jgi:hypothetical protein